MVGKEEVFLATIVKYSLHEETNDKDHRLINYASAEKMIIGSTYHPNKKNYKGTRRFPDGKAWHKSNLVSTQGFRGANIDSDHYLTVSRIGAMFLKDIKSSAKVTERIDTIQKSVKGTI